MDTLDFRRLYSWSCARASWSGCLQGGRAQGGGGSASSEGRPGKSDVPCLAPARRRERSHLRGVQVARTSAGARCHRATRPVQVLTALAGGSKEEWLGEAHVTPSAPSACLPAAPAGVQLIGEHFVLCRRRQQRVDVVPVGHEVGDEAAGGGRLGRGLRRGRRRLLAASDRQDKSKGRQGGRRNFQRLSETFTHRVTRIQQWLRLLPASESHSPPAPENVRQPTLGSAPHLLLRASAAAPAATPAPDAAAAAPPTAIRYAWVMVRAFSSGVKRPWGGPPMALASAGRPCRAAACGSAAGAAAAAAGAGGGPGGGGGGGGGPPAYARPASGSGPTGMPLGLAKSSPPPPPGPLAADFFQRKKPAPAAAADAARSTQGREQGTAAVMACGIGTLMREEDALEVHGRLAVVQVAWQSRTPSVSKLLCLLQHSPITAAAAPTAMPAIAPVDRPLAGDGGGAGGEGGGGEETGGGGRAGGKVGGGWAGGGGKGAPGGGAFGGGVSGGGVRGGGEKGGGVLGGGVLGGGVLGGGVAGGGAPGGGCSAGLGGGGWLGGEASCGGGTLGGGCSASTV